MTAKSTAPQVALRAYDAAGNVLGHERAGQAHDE